jgi:C1A family cysteine protease
VASKVKDQGECRSCWTFSTVAAIEALYALEKGEKWLDLSE